MKRRELANALVLSPTTRYEKARAVIGDGTLRVMDRRSQELASVEGYVVAVDARTWTLTTSGGEVWMITQRSGCGCGGTRVTPL